MDEDQTFNLPVSQMGNYQEYLKKKQPPLRELEAAPSRQHMFGNPFKLDKKNPMIIDEADIELSNNGGGNGGSNSGGDGQSKGMKRSLSSSALAAGVQGGPLEHVIAAKAVAFGEALSPNFKEYGKQIQRNAQAMAQAFIEKGYKIISGGTDNHCMLIDLRAKFPELSGKVAEKALVLADITVNKNMVPFDSRSAFQTSGIRVGTAAITTRGVKEDKMAYIVELIDRVLSAPEDDAVIAAVSKEVNSLMTQYPIFAW